MGRENGLEKYQTAVSVFPPVLGERQRLEALCVVRKRILSKDGDYPAHLTDGDQ